MLTAVFCRLAAGVEAGAGGWRTAGIRGVGSPGGRWMSAYAQAFRCPEGASLVCGGGVCQEAGAGSWALTCVGQG